MTVVIILLIISNIFSWAFVMHLASEIRQQNTIIDGLSDVFKEMAEKQ